MRFLTLCLATLAAPVAAHEFWIEPHAYLVDGETIIKGDLVNGEDFEGGKQPYLPQRFVKFQTFAQGKFADVPGRVGDNPGLRMDPIADGLHIFSYQSTPATLDYESWEKFQRFVDHKKFGDIRPLHDARGLPESGFTEVYTRFSKTLVGVGNAQGSDGFTGLMTEIVALTNPYTDDLSDGMTFQLYANRAPRANAAFEVFEKAPDDTVTITFYETDDQGQVTVPVKAGHSYMADAVILREPSADLARDTGAVWETLWANITWGVPE
jgi:uncharacterized GH25 family protein